MDHAQAVNAIYAAFGRGDVPAILEHLAEDVAWDQDGPGYGIPLFEPGSGKAHVEKFLAATQGLEFLRFDVTNLLAGGDQVAAVINLRVKVKATGKLVDVLEIHLWTFGADGKAARFAHVVDRHAFALAYDMPLPVVPQAM